MDTTIMLPPIRDLGFPGGREGTSDVVSASGDPPPVVPPPLPPPSRHGSINIHNIHHLPSHNSTYSPQPVRKDSRYSHPILRPSTATSAGTNTYEDTQEHRHKNPYPGSQSYRDNQSNMAPISLVKPSPQHAHSDLYLRRTDIYDSNGVWSPLSSGVGSPITASNHTDFLKDSGNNTNHGEHTPKEIRLGSTGLHGVHVSRSGHPSPPVGISSHPSQEQTHRALHSPTVAYPGAYRDLSRPSNSHFQESEVEPLQRSIGSTGAKATALSHGYNDDVRAAWLANSHGAESRPGSAFEGSRAASFGSPPTYHMDEAGDAETVYSHAEHRPGSSDRWNFFPTEHPGSPSLFPGEGRMQSPVGKADENTHQSSKVRRSSMASTNSSETTARYSDGGSRKRRSISIKKEFKCRKKDGCDMSFKCDSLRKKHEMKHTRPFKCSEPDCPKYKCGFTTSNDLRRHMKALHDNEGGWRCKYCPPESLGFGGSKGFFSTRKDNFRNHIKRIHNGLRAEGESMDDFFRRSEKDCRIESPTLLPTVLSSSTSYMDIDMPTSDRRELRGSSGSLSPDSRLPGTFARLSIPSSLDAKLTSTENNQLPAPEECSSRPYAPESMSGDNHRVPILRAVLPTAALNFPSAAQPMKNNISSVVHTPDGAHCGLSSLQQSGARRGFQLVQADDLHSLKAREKYLADELERTRNRIAYFVRTMSEKQSGTDIDMAEAPVQSPIGKSLARPCESGRVLVADLLNRDSDVPSTTTPGPDEIFSPARSPPLPAVVARRFPAAPVSERPSRVSDSNLYRRPQSWMQPLRKGQVTNGVTSKEYKEQCPRCPSIFRLPCQLRKHMKRHSKPFGCTHDGCNKVFGAKNDWKRHENSQHHQLECWKCDVPTVQDPTIPCGKCVFRKADFVKHLRDVHNNTDGWVSADRPTTATASSSSTTGGRDAAQIISTCHIPKYHGGAFWCGFCKKVVQLNGTIGIEGWDKRFDHIALHFEKEKKQVKDDWMKLEDSPLDDKAPGDDEDSETEEPVFQDEKLQRVESPPPPAYPPPRSRRGTGNEDRAPTMGWVCCKCSYGPYNPTLYADCSMCGAHRCQQCLNKPIAKED